MICFSILRLQAVQIDKGQREEERRKEETQANEEEEVINEEGEVTWQALEVERVKGFWHRIKIHGIDKNLNLYKSLSDLDFCSKFIDSKQVSDSQIETVVKWTVKWMKIGMSLVYEQARFFPNIFWGYL